MPKKKRNRAETSMPVNIVLPGNLSADEMKHIIADGLMEFEERKSQREKEEKESKRREWRQAIGVKDFSEVKGPKRWFLQFSNDIAVMCRACFLPKKYIKGDGMTFGIIQLLLTAIFVLLYLIFLLVSAVLFLFGLVVLVLFIRNSFPIAVGTLAVSWLYGFLALAFSGVFRVAGIEITHMEDRSYLFGLLACLASVVAAVAAVVTIFLTLR